MTRRATSPSTTSRPSFSGSCSYSTSALGWIPTGTPCSRASRPCPETWSACVCVSSVRTIRTPSCSAAARYCSISYPGSTTNASPAAPSPTRYDAQPRSASTNWRKITPRRYQRDRLVFLKLRRRRARQPAAHRDERNPRDQRRAAEDDQDDQPGRRPRIRRRRRQRDTVRLRHGDNCRLRRPGLVVEAAGARLHRRQGLLRARCRARPEDAESIRHRDEQRAVVAAERDQLLAEEARVRLRLAPEAL